MSRATTAGGRPEVSVPEGRRLRQLADIEVGVLRGVGEAAGRELGQLGIATVLDLLTYYPRRYIDGSRLARVGDLAVGESASVLAEVRRVRAGGPPRRGGRGRPSRVELVVGDATGSLPVVFFNQSWRAGQLPVGTLALFFGKLGSYRDAPQLVNPVVEVVRSGPGDDGDAPVAGRIFAVYPLSEKSDLTSMRLSRYAAEALDRAGAFADPLDDRLRGELSLTDRTTAFGGIHRPGSVDDHVRARRRLAFDELFRLQLALVLRQARLRRDARGIRHAVGTGGDAGPLVGRFVDGLPFAPTGAQRRAMDDVFADMAGPLPMHRLLQGDVGSGKTVVAAATLLAAVQGGYQGAFMAPTEVLAEQHHQSIRALVDGITVPDDSRLGHERPLAVALLTNRTTGSERTRLKAGLEAGDVDIVIGTHALLTDDVQFARLGAVVIDEQHRFGVEQRAALRDKGRGPDGTGADPDLLVMTATPIPRTAAMVVFGDLDMTTIDELPPGRVPVTTHWCRTEMDTAAAWERVRTEAAAGRRAYVVCPLVDSGRVEAASVTEEAERLAEGELAGLRIGLLHGQLRPADKDAVMASFRAGETDVLVATTVIEVGVDVPEATVMVIEDADRFGIAQLHQLRGRVGRGGDASWCYLLSATDNPDAEQRLSALERTSDGFALADVDLELRGEGTILGERQKGRSDLRLARLLRDRDLVELARGVAEQVAADGTLDGQPLLEEELRLFVDEEDAAFLFKS